jgi:hypothetical protein
MITDQDRNNIEWITRMMLSESDDDMGLGIALYLKQKYSVRDIIYNKYIKGLDYVQSIFFLEDYSTRRKFDKDIRRCVNGYYDD